MSAGDYRKPEGKVTENSMPLWFNWAMYEMAARLGYVQRKGVSTTTAENVDLVNENGINEGPFDMEELMDEFFDKFDELKAQE